MSDRVRGRIASNEKIFSHGGAFLRRCCLAGAAVLAVSAGITTAASAQDHTAPGRTFAYVADALGKDVWVIDTDTNKITATVPAGENPWDMAASKDGTRVYVSNVNSNDVSVIDTATNKVTATIPVGEKPGGVAVSPDGSRVYVTDQLKRDGTQVGDVSVIDTATNKVTHNIALYGKPDGFGKAAISPDGTRLYATADRESAEITTIDTASNSVINTRPVGHDITGMEVGPDGTRMYVSSYGSKDLSVVDTANDENKVIASVPIGGQAQMPAIAGTHVYVPSKVDGGQGQVSKIDIATNKVTATIPTPGKVPWDGMAAAQDGSHVYMTDAHEPTMSVIDTATDTVSDISLPGIARGVTVVSVPQG